MMKHQPVSHLKRSTSRRTMMKLCCVLVLFLAGTASGNIEKRIVGSTSCGKERQYHVKIESVERGKSCGGALLNTLWVITASHCAEQKVKVKIGVNNDVSVFTKIAAFVKGSSKNLEQVITTEKQFTFKNEDGKLHDIMLIKLNEGVSAQLPTIRLPSGECKRPEEKTDVRIGGMGPKTAGGQHESQVRCATVQMLKCGENDKPSVEYHSDETATMCAFKPGVETCFGDGGSAVEVAGVLRGITISDPKDKCAHHIVMLDICFYMKWIEETMHK